MPARRTCETAIGGFGKSSVDPAGARRTRAVESVGHGYGVFESSLIIDGKILLRKM